MKPSAYLAWSPTPRVCSSLFSRVTPRSRDCPRKQEEVSLSRYRDARVSSCFGFPLLMMPCFRVLQSLVHMSAFSRVPKNYIRKWECTKRTQGCALGHPSKLHCSPGFGIVGNEKFISLISVRWDVNMKIPLPYSVTALKDYTLDYKLTSLTVS